MSASKGNVPDVRNVDIYFCKPGGLGEAEEGFLHNISEDKETTEIGARVAVAIMQTFRVAYSKRGMAREDTSLAHLKGARSATNSSSLTKPIQKSQVMLVDILKNLEENDIIFSEHGLSSEITMIPCGSSDTNEGSKNSFWNEEPCGNVHQVGDEREVEVLCSFNWPLSQLKMEDGVLPERGFWNEEPCGNVHQVGDEREVEVLCSFNWPLSQLKMEDGVLPEREREREFSPPSLYNSLLLLSRTTTTAATAAHRRPPAPFSFFVRGFQDFKV
nr:hypothetical protein [Tanacetum cinerariifolium]